MAVATAPTTMEADSTRDWAAIGAVALRWLVAILGAFVVFGAFMVLKGVNPFVAYQDMFVSTFGNVDSIGEILIKAAPIVFAALAVAVPARAGLMNVGGEGQLVIGGVAAAGVSLAIGDSAPGAVTLLVMMVAAAVAGAAWASIAGVLKMTVGINEAVTTLLMNYIAVDVMSFLIFDTWKDLEGSGQPSTKAVPIPARLSLLGDSRVHVGVIIAAILVGGVYLLVTHTTWGFRLGVVGGNPEAARRAGFKVGALMIGAIAVGGALAGLGGFVQLAGVEFKLRQGFLVGYGYIGYLASWLARHHPLKVAVGALALAAIAVGGDSLQIDSGLPAAAVNVLMGLVLLAVFGWTRTKKAGA